MSKPTTIKEVLERVDRLKTPETPDGNPFMPGNLSVDEALATIEQLVLETKPEMATKQNSPGYVQDEISAYNHGIRTFEKALSQLLRGGDKS